MLLKLDQATVPMQLVYLLSEELKVDPKQVELTQALTLNKSKPNIGLKGTYGLYGSEEWWENIRQGKMPLRYETGVIHRMYEAGQDRTGRNNAFDLVLEDASIKGVSIYVNKKKDAHLFKAGHRVQIAYVLDDLKPNYDGVVDYLDLVIEMAVSLDKVS